MNHNSSSIKQEDSSSWNTPPTANSVFGFQPCWENAGLISDNNLAVGSTFRPCNTALPVFSSSQGMLRSLGLYSDGCALQNRIDLNLGVRTYFPTDDLPADRLFRRPRYNSQATHFPRCQVDGCNADLRCAPKHYHRRHKVCELHSKAASVFSGGQMQRFCQQCSRFHPLSEFDDAKRSCRKRLADHNRRRRKINNSVLVSHSNQSNVFHNSITISETQSLITPHKASEADCEGNLCCAIHHANQPSRISSMLESLEQQHRVTMARVGSGGDEAHQFLYSCPSPITTSSMQNLLRPSQQEQPHLPYLDLQQALKPFGASMYN